MTLDSAGQSFLNGGFEINTAGFDQINLDNNSFNGFMSNTIAYGSFGNIDIVASNTYCNGPQSGNWFLCLTGGQNDAITMELSTALIAGQSYSISFWDRGCIAFSSGPMPIQIGVTNTNGTTGTIVYTAPVAIESQWTERVFNFIAPVGALYISASLIDNSAGVNTSTWAHIDNFLFVTPTCPLVLNLGIDQTICAGESFSLDATLPGATYVWQDGSTSATYNVSTGGTYSVVASVGDCDYTDSVIVTEIPQIDIELGSDIQLCPIENIAFNVTTAGATYLWQDGSTLATYVANSTEQVSVVVSIGQCSSNDNTSVTLLDFPAIDLGQNVTVCIGTSVLLDAGNAGYTYVWQDGSTAQTYSPTTSGQYSVDYSNGICVGSDQVNVTFNPLPLFEWEEDSIAICFDASEILSAATPGATYLWSDGSTNSEISINTSGTYIVEISINGCSVNDTMNVSVIASDSIQLITSEICIAETGFVVISDENLHDDLTWSNGQTGNSITVEEAGLYSASLPSECATIFTAVFVPECPDLNFYMPNAITPNGDGINDVLFPGLYLNFEFDSFEFVILNRFSEPVFKTNDIYEVWDGGHQGSRYYVRDGVYVWQMKLTYRGNFLEKTGHIVIIR